MHNKQYNIKNEEQKKTSKNVEQKKKRNTPKKYTVTYPI